jgi:hypothetical protein
MSSACASAFTVAQMLCLIIHYKETVLVRGGDVSKWTYDDLFRRLHELGRLIKVGCYRPELHKRALLESAATIHALQEQRLTERILLAGAEETFRKDAEEKLHYIMRLIDDAQESFNEPWIDPVSGVRMGLFLDRFKNSDHTPSLIDKKVYVPRRSKPEFVLETPLLKM